MEMKQEVKLHGMPWFHGKISRDQAEQLLFPREDGLFLVRESTNFPGDYTLCVCYQGKVEHYRVIYKDSKLTIDEEEYFTNLVELVEHYEKDADGLCTHLTISVPKKGKQDFFVDRKAFEEAGWVIQENDLVDRVENFRQHRSKPVGGEKWLDHRSGVSVPLGTILQPLMRKRKSVTELGSAQDVGKCDRYVLTTQDKDSSGKLETRLYKILHVPYLQKKENIPGPLGHAKATGFGTILCGSTATMGCIPVRRIQENGCTDIVSKNDLESNKDIYRVAVTKAVPYRNRIYAQPANSKHRIRHRTESWSATFC